MIDFNNPEMVNVGEVILPVYRGGPALADTEKPPVVFLHGWPDLAITWKHQMEHLAALGYPVFAPDQRGYGKSTKPEGKENYTAAKLTGDLAGLLDHYHIEKAVFVGHDWGAILLWHMPFYQPERVLGYAGLAVPLMKHYPMDPISLFKARFGEKMYIVRFQQEGACEPVLEQDLEATFKFFHRRPGKGKSVGGNFSFSVESLDLISLLEAGEDAWGGEQLLHGEDLAYYVRSFKESGFTGPLHWYRNMAENWKAQKQFLVDGALPKVEAPCLMITAELDRACPPSLSDGMEDMCEPFERIDLMGCGHWLTVERTPEVNNALEGWLARHFG
jgi:pimeloyl-ACP methyl ester carboxylesterase